MTNAKVQMSIEQAGAIVEGRRWASTTAARTRVMVLRSFRNGQPDENGAVAIIAAVFAVGGVSEWLPWLSTSVWRGTPARGRRTRRTRPPWLL